MRDTQTGIGLLEMLLASAIVAGSLAGLFELQRTLLRHQGDAWRQLAARQQLRNLNEMMRINAEARYDFESAASANCAQTRCSPDQLAAYEIERVSRALDDLLLDWRGAIDADGAMTLRYRSPGGGDVRLEIAR